MVAVVVLVALRILQSVFAGDLLKDKIEKTDRLLELFQLCVLLFFFSLISILKSVNNLKRC